MIDKIEWPSFTAINLETYPRRHIYEHFLDYEIPFTSRTTQLDITNLKNYIQNINLKFSLVFSFLLTRATNHVPELRHRIQDDILVEFDKIIPSFTVLSKEKVIYFSKGTYTDNFQHDYNHNHLVNEEASKGFNQIHGAESQGQIFITNIPWYSFTSIQHPYSRKNASIPIFSIGKIYEENGRTKVPLGIQSHHSIIDGYHISCFLDILIKHLDEPELISLPYQHPLDD